MLPGGIISIKCVSCRNDIEVNCAHLVHFCKFCKKVYVTSEVRDGSYLAKAEEEVKLAKEKAEKEKKEKAEAKKAPAKDTSKSNVRLASLQMASALCPACDKKIEINYAQPVGFCKYCRKPYVSKEVIAGTAKKMVNLQWEVKKSDNKNKSAVEKAKSSSAQMISVNCPACTKSIEMNYMYPVGFCKFCKKPYVTKEVLEKLSGKKTTHIKAQENLDGVKKAIVAKTKEQKAATASLQTLAVQCPACTKDIEVNYMYPVGFCKFCKKPYITKEILDKLGVKTKNAQATIKMRADLPVKDARPVTVVGEDVVREAITKHMTTDVATMNLAERKKAPTKQAAAKSVTPIVKEIKKRTTGAKPIAAIKPVRIRKDGLPYGSPRIKPVSKRRK